MKFSITDLDWTKMQNLIPAIVQDATTGQVLMLGYMNQESLSKTIETKYVTFFSRSKNTLWTKGETSGNKLQLIDILMDCDNDSLLIFTKPLGPTCHKETQSCYGENNNWNYIKNLETTIQHRAIQNSPESYTVKLLQQGISRITQKVGEESIEVVIAALKKMMQNFAVKLLIYYFIF